MLEFSNIVCSYVYHFCCASLMDFKNPFTDQLLAANFNNVWRLLRIQICLLIDTQSICLVVVSRSCYCSTTLFMTKQSGKWWTLLNVCRLVATAAPDWMLYWYWNMRCADALRGVLTSRWFCSVVCVMSGPKLCILKNYNIFSIWN